MKLPAQRVALAALLVCFALVLYWLVEESVLTNPLIVGALALTSLVLLLWRIYQRRPSLDSEASLLLGLGTQYLLAPMVMLVMTGNFSDPGFIETQEREAVKEAYPLAICVVLLFVGVVVVVGRLVDVRRPPREADGSLMAPASASFGRLVIVGMIGLWVVRLILLQTGSYYHLVRSDFQLEDWRYSILAQTESVLSLFILALIVRPVLTVGRTQPDAIAVLFVGGYVVIDLLWNFISGGRERTLNVFVCIAACYMVCRDRVPTRLLLGLGAGALCLITFLDYYRYAMMRGQADPDTISMASVQDGLEASGGQFGDVGWGQKMTVAVSRVNELDSVAAIVFYVPKSLPFLKGETYLTVPTVFVPRFLWPTKPMTIMPINTWFFKDEGGSSPLTVMGEAYMNFGALGVVFCGVVAGILLRATENALVRRSQSVAFLPVYVTFLMTVARLPTQALAVWVGSLLKIYLLMWLCVSAEPLLRWRR